MQKQIFAHLKQMFLEKGFDKQIMTIKRNLTKTNNYSIMEL